MTNIFIAKNIFLNGHIVSFDRTKLSSNKYFKFNFNAPSHVTLLNRLLHSKQQHVHSTYNTTYIELYVGNILAKKIAHIVTATYKISEHYIGVIVSVIRAACRICRIYGSCMGREKK